ncbi:MAG: hypothetical protein M4579_004737 [Chaenotheca gracillima]|nr:MAG: hypothetical protein M4579_004737 [Chaenotheca gracillima]
MSLVPYSSHESSAVVLRNDSALVVYDENRKQLALRAAPSSTSDVDFPAECPYCHRPIQIRDEYRGDRRGEEDEVPSSSSGLDVDVGFVSPEYFRMLRDHDSEADADDLSPPSSPQRRLTRPLADSQRSTTRSGGARARKGTPRLPSAEDAEFVSSSPTTAAHGISSAAFSPNYFERFFVEENILGTGGKGVVLLVRHVLDGVSLGYFACKRVPVGDDHQWLEKVLVEVQLLQHLSHQNLVSYRHVWLEDVKLSNFGPSVPCAFILQQYCNAGDLREYVCSPAEASPQSTTEQLKERLRRRSKGHIDVPELKKAPRRLPFEEVYSFFKGIASGLNHLHKNGFIHRDLKPSNCLLHDTGTEVRVLVSDFGEAQRESMSRRSTGATGTISYCAPEVLRRVYPNGPLGEFTAKSDIFSLGMILYFMCFGRLPYKNANDREEIDDNIEQLRDEISAWAGFDDKRKARSDLPDQLYKFLKRLLSHDPVDRPSAEEVLWGISTGGKDSSPPNHTHSGIFDEIRGNSRISPIETPPPGTPTGQWSGGSSGVGAGVSGRRMPPANAQRLTRPGPSKLRSRSFQEDLTPPPPSEQQAYNTSSADDNEEDNTGRGLEHAHGHPQSSLVLRKRPYALASSSSAPTTPHPNSQQHSPSQWTPLRPSQRHIPIPAQYHSLLKIFLFLFKLFSIYQPCSPLASNPWISYPLICLAVLDVISLPWGNTDPMSNSSTSSRGVTLVLSLIHVVMLVIATRWNLLCLSRQEIFLDSIT